MAGRKNDPFTTLGDDAFPPDDDAGPSGARDDEYRSLRGDEFDIEEAKKEIEKGPSKPAKGAPRKDEYQSLLPGEFDDLPPIKEVEKTPSVPVFKDRKSELPVPDARNRAKPKDHYTRVGDAETGATPPTRTPRNLGETTAPDGADDLEEPGHKKPLVSTPKPGVRSKHVVDLRDIPEDIRNTRRGHAPQNGDDLASLLLDHEIVTKEDWEEALDNVDNNLNNIPAILKQLSQQKASWTEEYPEHYPALTQYQVQEIWAGRGLSLRACGAFVILDVLGEGGMGKVYKARGLGQFDSPRFYAIKTIRADNESGQNIYGTPSSSTVGRFRKEADILAKLRHPNLPVIYISDMSMDGVPFIVMDFLKGPTLEEIVKEKTDANELVDFKWATRTVIQIADVLHHAHSHKDAAGEPRPVIHRDIKPANVIMQDGKTPMLVDLGIAKLSSSNKPGSKVAPGETMAKNTPLGTPAYMPFEQWAEAASVTPAADVYSLAGTYYNLLTGELPFPAEDSQSLMYQVMTAERPKVSAKRRDVPKELDAILERAMAIKSEDRYQSAEEFAAALRALVSEREDVWRKVAAITSIAAIVLIGFAWWFWPKPADPNVIPQLQEAATQAYAQAIKGRTASDWEAVAKAYDALIQAGDSNAAIRNNLRLSLANLGLRNLAGANKVVVDSKLDTTNLDSCKDDGAEFIKVLLDMPPTKFTKPEDVTQFAPIIDVAERIVPDNSMRSAVILERGKQLLAAGKPMESASTLARVVDKNLPKVDEARAVLKEAYAKLFADKSLVQDELLKHYRDAKRLSAVAPNDFLPNVTTAFTSYWREPITNTATSRPSLLRADEDLVAACQHNPEDNEARSLLALVKGRLDKIEEYRSLLAMIAKHAKPEDVVKTRKEMIKLLSESNKLRDDEIVAANEINKTLPASVRDKEIDQQYEQYRRTKDDQEGKTIPAHLLESLSGNPAARRKAFRDWASQQLKEKKYKRLRFVFETDAIVAARDDFRDLAATAYMALASDEKEPHRNRLLYAKDAQRADPARLAAYDLWRDIELSGEDPERLEHAVAIGEQIPKAVIAAASAASKLKWAEIYDRQGTRLLNAAAAKSEFDIAKANQSLAYLRTAIGLYPDFANAIVRSAEAEIRIARADGQSSLGRLQNALAGLNRAKSLPGIDAELAKSVPRLQLDCCDAIVKLLPGLDLDAKSLEAAAAACDAGLQVVADAPTEAAAVRRRYKSSFVSFAKKAFAGWRRDPADAALRALCLAAMEKVSTLDPASKNYVAGWREVVRVAGMDKAAAPPAAASLKSLIDGIADGGERAEVQTGIREALVSLALSLKANDDDPSIVKALAMLELAATVDPNAAAKVRSEHVFGVIDSLIARANIQIDTAFANAKGNAATSMAAAEAAIALLNRALPSETRRDKAKDIAMGMSRACLAEVEALSPQGKLGEAFAACEKAVGLTPDYYYAQIYLVATGIYYCGVLGDSPEDLAKCADVVSKSIAAACRAIVVRPPATEPNKHVPREQLVRCLRLAKGQVGNAKLLFQLFDEPTRKRFVTSTIKLADSTFNQVEKRSDVPADDKAALATTIAFLRLFGGEPDNDEGFKFATKAVELSKNADWLPLFVLAHFQESRSETSKAHDSLDEAEKAAEKKGDKAAIEDIKAKRAKLPNKT